MKAMDSSSECAFSILTYAIKQAAMGNIKTVLSLGLDHRQINELLTLNTQEIHDMASMAKVNLINIQFDPEAMDIALNINTVKSLRRKEIFQMLKAGASFPVMHHLYGLTQEDIGYYRKVAEVDGEISKGGRPSHASESEQEAIWELMKSAKSLNSRDLASLLLNAHQKTGVKINTIWGLLQEWWGTNQQQSDVCSG